MRTEEFQCFRKMHDSSTSVFDEKIKDLKSKYNLQCTEGEMSCASRECIDLTLCPLPVLRILPIDENEDEQEIKSFRDSLAILSKKFDSLNIPTLDLNVGKDELLEQVANRALYLIHLHRKNVSRKDALEEDCGYLHRKYKDMLKQISKAHEQAEEVKFWQGELEMKYLMKNEKLTEIIARVKQLKEETERSKIENASREAELKDEFSKYENKLKWTEEFIKTYNQNKEEGCKLLTDYKEREAAYKKKIAHLKGKNDEFIKEIIDLKTDYRRIQQKFQKSDSLTSYIDEQFPTLSDL